MQLPRLYRRGVVRPLDEQAANELATYFVEKPIRVEWLAVPGDDQFDEIWEAGILQQINEACGIEISDYEEVELKASDVRKALHVLGNADHGNRDVVMFFEGLKALLTEAEATASSVYFIF